MKIVRNAQNYDYKTMTDGIDNKQHSETIPNNVMTMQEMVDKYISGDNMLGLRNFDYDTERTMELPEIAKMSTIDRARYLLEVKEDIDHETGELKEIQESLAKRKANKKRVIDNPPEKPETPEAPPT